MPPGIPGLREAVAEDHQRAFAGLGDMHVDAVGLYDAMVDIAQGLDLLRHAADIVAGDIALRRATRGA